LFFYFFSTASPVFPWQPFFTLAHRFLANQFRLLLHTFSYCFIWFLRESLQGTEYVEKSPLVYFLMN